MEASALTHTPSLVGRSPLLRLQSDDRLVALIRRGHHGAFEALMQRYQSRLLAFCRHMLGSTEDAEDVLQEVFASAFNAICADERPINARPWLYRIARNRCLNHLRRPTHAGQDSMDVFERDGGATTADTVHRREEFRQLVADVGDLPETQRTALLLREIDALSYEQIAEAMDTTVPSIKSLLVRARVSLAEAAEARLLTCAEVRLELGQVEEGLAKTTAPVRRHLKHCDRCQRFRQELRKTSKVLAAVYPLGPLVVLQKLVLGKLGGSAGAAAGGTAASSGALAGGGAAAGGVVSSAVATIASKTTAGIVAAAVVTAGAVEIKHVRRDRDRSAVAPAPAVVEEPRRERAVAEALAPRVTVPRPAVAPAPARTSPEPAAEPAATAATPPATASPAPAQPAPAPSSSTPPPSDSAAESPSAGGQPPAGEQPPQQPQQPPPGEPTTPPGEPRGAPVVTPPAPPAGEPAPAPIR